MKRDIKIIIMAGLLLLYPAILHGDGHYSIGEDQGGLYMETEQDGSWYIDQDHIKGFRLGEKGTYSTGIDGGGPYILVGKKRRFYIDKRAHEQFQSELEAFNERNALEPESETRVIIEGNQVLVPVILAYGGHETEVLLLLDTGATIIVLHREVAERLNMKSIKKGRLMLAGGDAIDADLVKLDSVKAGPITKKGVAATVIQYKGPDTRHEGLLGMNFLKGLAYRIDLTRQTIVWER